MINICDYRGHLRNWRALCGELGIKTDLSRVEREKEIIVRAYEKWGSSMGDHFYGMFAFALYDTEENKYFCLRDQFGTKPFYYYITKDNRLLFGTNISRIIGQEGFVKELNADMLQIYMTLTYVAGEDTFFKGVKKLMPGHWLEFKDGSLKIERYWTPSFKPDESRTLDEWADEIHETIKEIFCEVKDEEETAESFLSGGVDSSYVLEHFSVLRAYMAVDRADVCVIMLDATEGFTEQDSKVAGYAHEQGKACVVAVNKWDLVEKDDKTMQEFRTKLENDFSFMSYVPFVFISAKTGQRINKLYELIKYTFEQNSMRISTGMLNDVLAYATTRVQPPSDKGRRLKIYYMTQPSTKPPTFVTFVNRADLFHFSYRRYIENQIRSTFGLEGTPVRFIVRERGGNDK